MSSILIKLMKRFALLVASDKYPDAKIADLKCAEADAKGLGAWLKGHGGYDPDHTEILTGPSVTRDSVLDWSRQLCAELSEGDLFVCYIALHGIYDKGQQWFLPGSARRDNTEGWISYEQLRDLDGIGTCARIFLFDACQRGLEALSVAEPRRAVHRELEPVERSHSNPGALGIIRACREYELSSESEQIGQGLFTEALLSELDQAREKGKALHIGEGLTSRIESRISKLVVKHGLTGVCQNQWLELNQSVNLPALYDVPPDEHPVPGNDWRIPRLGISLRWVPPGSFTKGDGVTLFDDREPVEEVRFGEGFWLGSMPVRKREYDDLIRGDALGGSSSSDTELDQIHTGVTWHEAMDWCQKLNALQKSENRVPPLYVYTLPTVDEYEWAARFGVDTITDPVRFSEKLRTLRSDLRHPFGQPNSLGIFGLLGVVDQWCCRCVSDQHSSSRLMPIKGGHSDVGELPCHFTAVEHREKNIRDISLGFRVALVPRCGDGMPQ